MCVLSSGCLTITPTQDRLIPSKWSLLPVLALNTMSPDLDIAQTCFALSRKALATPCLHDVARCIFVLVSPQEDERWITRWA